MTANGVRILSTICLSIFLTTAIFAQTGQKIARIETEGLQNLTAETVIATSGLKIGETFSVTATDAAAGRFFRDDAREIFSRIAQGRQAQGRPMPNLGTQEGPNRQTLIVNLVIELKD